MISHRFNKFTKVSGNYRNSNYPRNNVSGSFIERPNPTPGPTATNLQDGNPSFKNTMTVEGLLTANENLKVRGNSTISGSSAVAGNSTVTGNSVVGGNSAVAGSSAVAGNSTVTGNSVVGGNASIDGNISIDGKLDVVGSATVQSLIANDQIRGGHLLSNLLTLSTGGETIKKLSITTAYNNRYLAVQTNNGTYYFEVNTAPKPNPTPASTFPPTPTPGSTFPPSATPAQTPNPTPSVGPTKTPQPSSTVAPTATPFPTPTITPSKTGPTPTPSPSKTSTPTPTPSPTKTVPPPTSTLTMTPRPTSAPTSTPRPTPTPTITGAVGTISLVAKKGPPIGSVAVISDVIGASVVYKVDVEGSQYYYSSTQGDWKSLNLQSSIPIAISNTQSFRVYIKVEGLTPSTYYYYLYNGDRLAFAPSGKSTQAWTVELFKSTTSRRTEIIVYFYEQGS